MQINLNSQFLKNIFEILNQNNDFSIDLNNILDGDFIIREDCFFLSSLNQQSHYSLKDFEDNKATLED